jgi:hypothetical protein
MKNPKTKKTSKRTAKSPELAGATPLGDLKINFVTQGIDKSAKSNAWQKRILIFSPTTGLVRMEWVQARYGQIIPTNWSHVEITQFLNPYIPVGYQLADAQNLMAKTVVEQDYEWIIYIEHDNVIPPDGFLRFNQYINEQKIPVVSGLYWLKSNITEPLLYRGAGQSYFKDWKLGDRVWVDGIPFGFRLEHGSLIKAAWEESEEYEITPGVRTRRVFKQPGCSWFDEDKGGYVATGGTTDLEWCSRLINEGLFAKAGWPEFQKMKYPFLVDTNIFVKHIDQNGRVYPLAIPDRFLPPKGYKGKTIR